MSITFTVTPNPQSEWYGTLVVSDIQAVTAQSYLALMFKSPASVMNTNINGSTNPWVEITPAVISQKELF